MMLRTDALMQRHEFVLFFDIKNGNPNGDPDAGNMPRIDPETGYGLVSDVCVKRKIRNFVDMTKMDAQRFRIYVTDGAVLNEKHREAYIAERPNDPSVKDIKVKKLTPGSDDEAVRLRNFMCENFYDIRTFGAVLSTGINAGQVRGPVQIMFAQSAEPITPLEISITRMAVTSEKEKEERKDGDDDHEKRGDKRTMGRKHIIPYGLYRVHGFVSAPLASHPVKGTGFSDEDLRLLFEAVWNMFEHDRSASRGEMAARKLYVFRHATALGVTHAEKLFDRVTVRRAHQGSVADIGDERTDNWPPARRFADYQVSIDRGNWPDGVELLEDEAAFAPPASKAA